MRFKLVVLLLIFTSSQSFPEGNTLVDSLLDVTQSTTNDTNKVNAYITLMEIVHIGDRNSASIYLNKADSILQIYERSPEATIPSAWVHLQRITIESRRGLVHYYNANLPAAIEQFSKALVLAEKHEEKGFIGDLCNDLASMYDAAENLEKAEEFHLRSLKIRREIDDKIGIGQSLNNLGYMYSYHGRIVEAIELLHESLQVRESIGDKRGVSICLNNLGNIFITQEDYDKAIEYQERSLKIREELGNPKMIATGLNSIGVTYYEKHDNVKALEYYMKAYEIRKEINNLRGITNSINNIANVHFRERKYDLAIKSYHELLRLNRESQDLKSATQSLINLAFAYSQMESYNLALAYADSALAMAREYSRPDKIERVTRILKTIHKRLGNYEMALTMFELNVKMKDSLNNAQTQKASIRQQTKYEFEKAALVKEQEEKEVRRKTKEVRQRRDNLQYSVILIALLGIGGLLAVIGKFSIPIRVVEGMIFFAFLLFFEFLLVLADPSIERWSGGAPGIKLLFNAGIAALIFPLHSLFERKLKERLVN